MSVRSLRHLFEPERILWIGPAGAGAAGSRLAEANLWDAGFTGAIQRPAQHRPGTRRGARWLDLPT